MAHIALPEGVPGILGPMTQYPHAGEALRAFTEMVLRGPSSLSTAERELIAAYVSRLNECRFCANSHAAVSRHLLGEPMKTVVDEVLEDVDRASVSEKLRALLRLAGRVQQGGSQVQPDDVERARRAGADDGAIHDTVLTAAAFCMFNRYVDGLATWTPEEPAMYEQMGAALAAGGYLVGGGDGEHRHRG
jgi:uncharacterized peroxidase-related enzyme